MRLSCLLLLVSGAVPLSAQRPVPRPLPAQAPLPALAPLRALDPLPALEALPALAVEMPFIDTHAIRERVEAVMADRVWELEEHVEMARRDFRFEWRGMVEPVVVPALALTIGGPNPVALGAPSGRWPDDPADSLYRQARELLNRGEWRRAATVFGSIPQRFPNSAYAPDALYWQAFALYRIGGAPDLRNALAVLESQRAKWPAARTQTDAAALATRIRGALAARGDATAAAQISRAASDSSARCDREELAVRVEALSSLMQADPEGALPILRRVLARRDDCSEQLRRSAVFLVGSKRRDAEAVAQLTQVAKGDPSADVRSAAIEWLGRVPSEDVVGTLEELSRDGSDERVQRAAIRALVTHPAPRARGVVRRLVERTDVSERVRAEALGTFDRERTTADDIAWMRGLYTRLDNPRLKMRVVSALARVGGSDVDQWLLTLVRNGEEESEIRSAALRRVGQTLSVADVARLYDQSAERSVRESLINALSARSEPEATDKLIEIVKTGTDPQLRRSAINALTRKKDPRTTRLLMEIIDR